MNIDYFACIKLKYPDIKEEQFILSDNGIEKYISMWDPSLGSVPSLSELETYMLQVLKNMKHEEIKQLVHDEIDNSIIGYETQGLTTNIRLDAGKGDLDNLRNLKQYCQATGTTNTFIKDFYNNIHQITIDELDIIILELIAYGLWLYQRKWEVDLLIENASTEEELNSISFFG